MATDRELMAPPPWARFDDLVAGTALVCPPLLARAVDAALPAAP
jgi:hypothetical protein